MWLSSRSIQNSIAPIYMEEAIVTCQFLEEMTGRLQKENNWNRRVKNLERRDETVLYESEFS